MGKIISIGTSFNHGLGLHFYQRVKDNKKLNFQLEPFEKEHNLKYVFHNLLAEKLNYKSEIFFGQKLGLDTSFDMVIEGLKETIENDVNNEVKIIIWQLSNIEKDFFIYNDKIYRLNFNDENTLYDSKNEILNNVDESIKFDFEKKLDEEIQFWLKDNKEWRNKNAPWFVNKINHLAKYLKSKNIIFKVIGYYSDFSPFRKDFDENVYCNILIENRSYSHIHGFIWTEKLMLCNDLPTEDQHPNYKAHEVIANNLYKSIVEDPLYTHI